MGTLALLVAFATRPSVPIAPIVVGAGIVTNMVLGLSGRGVATIGTLRRALSARRLPALSDLAPDVVVVVMAVVVIGLVEMTAVAEAHDVNPFDGRQETVALGMSSIGAAFFAGMPIAGAPGRSALARLARARTPMTSAVTGLVVLALVGIGRSWLAQLPMAVVSALVVFGGLQLTDVPGLRRLLAEDRRQGIIALVTLGGTIVSPELGVGILLLASIVGDHHRRA